MEAISNVASGFIGLFQAGGETFMAVSYTHLDVYKRQAQDLWRV